MSDENTPQGQRFSLLYLGSDEQLNDSPRMRRRLATLISDHLSGHTLSAELGGYLEAELGIEVRSIGGNGYFVPWTRFFGKADIVDILDTITLVKRYADKNGLSSQYSNFGEDVQRIFNELQIAYRVDEDCGVHPHVDATFEQTRTFAIAGLTGDRYAAARQHIENTEHALIGAEIDGRQAIRSVFDAVENIFKMMFDGVTHINTREITNRLAPKITENYTAHDNAKNASLKLCDSFKSWVDGAHFYRHADGQPEPSQPPQELTIAMVSQGFGWVRWLASIDKARMEEQNNED